MKSEAQSRHNFSSLPKMRATAKTTTALLRAFPWFLPGPLFSKVDATYSVKIFSFSQFLTLYFWQHYHVSMKTRGGSNFRFLCELRRVRINQYRNPLGQGSHHFYKNSYYTFLWRGCFKAFVLICNMLKCTMSISLWLKTLLLKFPFNLFKLIKQDKTRVHPFLAPSIRGHRLPVHSSYLWACLYYVFVCFRFQVLERSYGLFLTFSLSIMLWRLQMLQIPIFYSF